MAQSQWRRWQWRRRQRALETSARAGDERTRENLKTLHPPPHCSTTPGRAGGGRAQQKNKKTTNLLVHSSFYELVHKPLKFARPPPQSRPGRTPRSGSWVGGHQAPGSRSTPRFDRRPATGSLCRGHISSTRWTCLGQYERDGFQSNVFAARAIESLTTADATRCIESPRCASHGTRAMHLPDSGWQPIRIGGMDMVPESQ